MCYEVFILSDAEEDLFDIYRYVAATDSSQKAKEQQEVETSFEKEMKTGLYYFRYE